MHPINIYIYAKICSISWITIKRNWLYAWFVRKIVNGFDVASHFKLLLFTKMLHMTYLIIFIASISLWRLYKWEKIYFYRLRLMSLHRNSFQSSMRNSHFLMILYVVNLQFFGQYLSINENILNQNNNYISIDKNNNPNQLSACGNHKKYNKGYKDIPTLNTLWRIAIYRNVDLFPIKHPGINCATQNLTKAVRICH